MESTTTPELDPLLPKEEPVAATSSSGTKMPSDAKKREQQRKEEAAKARQDEAQAAENGGERAPPTEAEEMASAPLTGIHSLPYETLSAIFSFLPIPDLARCAAVCKQWHDIVTGFTQLWEGKRYRSDRSPRESAEVYAVLHALPPLREVVVKTGECSIDISYPRLFLTVRDVSDSVSAEDGPRLELCPNLRERGIFAQFLSEDRLDASEGIGWLQVLDIECPGLKDLTFLRRYSDVLQELELKGCADMPSTAYAGLGQLGNLRRLRLRDCCVEAGDLEVAVKGMRRLASLRLEYCDLDSDLSFLQHCEQLQELCVKVWPPDAPLTGLRDLPAGLRSLHLDDVVDAADELLEAAPRLPLLEKLHLCFCELAHLDFLRRCPQLRILSLCGTTGLEKEAYREVCHVTTLQTLRIRYDVCDFVREVIRPCLPKVEIYFSEHYK